MVNVEVWYATKEVPVLDLVGGGELGQPSNLQGSRYVQEAVAGLRKDGTPVVKGQKVEMQYWASYLLSVTVIDYHINVCDEI